MTVVDWSERFRRAITFAAVPWIVVPSCDEDDKDGCCDPVAGPGTVAS